MEIKKRKTIFEDLKKYYPFASDDSYIEVTEWTNGEGVDITINDRNIERYISISHDELYAINYLTQTLSLSKD